MKKTLTILKLKFFAIILLGFIIENAHAQNRDSISYLMLRVKKIEYSAKNEAYFIYAKSNKLKKNFFILSPLSREAQLSTQLSPIKKRKSYLFKIEYLNKAHLIFGSGGIYNVFETKIVLKEEHAWYGEIVFAHNLFGIYYEQIP